MINYKMKNKKHNPKKEYEKFVRNRAAKRTLATLIKKIKINEEKKPINLLIATINSYAAKLAQKGIIHPNTAARKISRSVIALKNMNK